MPGENETNKNQGKHQDISKNVGDINSKEEDTQNYINTAEIKKGKDDLSDKSKIPNLQILLIRPRVLQNDVIFDDALPKFKAEVKAVFPELIIEIPGKTNTRNIIFLENTITLKEKYPISVQVPDLNIYHSPNIEMRNIDFNVSLVKAIDISGDLRMAIPNLNIDRIRPLIEKNITFDSTVMMEIKEFKDSKMQPIEQEPSDEPNNGGNSNIKFPWDEEIHKKLFLLGGVSSDENFKIIVVPDKEEYCEFIAMNFRDIYRIENGGYVYDVVRKKNITELREEFGKQTARHEIVIVKNGDDIIDTDNRNYLLDIIKNKPYQDLGLVVLVVNNIEKFREEIGTSDDVLILEEYDFQPLLEKYKALTKIIRGFSDYPASSDKFGDEFTNSVVEFDKKIGEYVSNSFIRKKLKGFDEAYRYFINNKDLLNATRSSSEKDASNIHSGMKSFIYVYERKNRSRDVEFEKNDIDVVADEKCYEAETLFGRKDVTQLLAGKMRKYSENNKGGICKEIIFTMRNIDIIRNFFSLRDFMEQNKDSKIKICGFDFEDGKLVPMNDMIGHLR